MFFTESSMFAQYCYLNIYCEQISAKVFLTAIITKKKHCIKCSLFLTQQIPGILIEWLLMTSYKTSINCVNILSRKK